MRVEKTVAVYHRSSSSSIDLPPRLVKKRGNKVLTHSGNSPFPTTRAPHNPSPHPPHPTKLPLPSSPSGTPLPSATHSHQAPLAPTTQSLAKGRRGLKRKKETAVAGVALKVKSKNEIKTAAGVVMPVGRHMAVKALRTHITATYTPATQQVSREYRNLRAHNSPINYDVKSSDKLRRKSHSIQVMPHYTLLLLLASSAADNGSVTLSQYINDTDDYNVREINTRDYSMTTTKAAHTLHRRLLLQQESHNHGGVLISVKFRPEMFRNTSGTNTMVEGQGWKMCRHNERESAKDFIKRQHGVTLKARCVQRPMTSVPWKRVTPVTATPKRVTRRKAVHPKGLFFTRHHRSKKPGPPYNHYKRIVQLSPSNHFPPIPMLQLHQHNTLQLNPLHLPQHNHLLRPGNKNLASVRLYQGKTDTMVLFQPVLTLTPYFRDKSPPTLPLTTPQPPPSPHPPSFHPSLETISSSTPPPLLSLSSTIPPTLPLSTSQPPPLAPSTPLSLSSLPIPSSTPPPPLLSLSSPTIPQVTVAPSPILTYHQQANPRVLAYSVQQDFSLSSFHLPYLHGVSWLGRKSTPQPLIKPNHTVTASPPVPHTHHPWPVGAPVGGGVPWVDYPSYASIPHTSFTCHNIQHPGLYGDVEAGCQVWHVCEAAGRQHSFLCPNGTLFNQHLLTCDWWYNVLCESSDDTTANIEDLPQITNPKLHFGRKTIIKKPIKHHLLKLEEVTPSPGPAFTTTQKQQQQKELSHKLPWAPHFQ